MTKKKGFFIAAGVLVAVVIGASIFTATTYADNRPNGGGFALGGKILDRVAQILGINQQKLVDAVKQATTEVRQDNFNTMLGKLVTDGKITQEQANQYKAWIASRPAGVLAGNQAMMDKLLKDGKVTQAQFDAWKAWMAKKPNFDLPKPIRPQSALPKRGPK
jgi:hypothetical protein